MPFSPQKFREIVFQLLYSDDFGTDTEVSGMLMAQLAVTKRILREATIVRDRVLEKKEEVDGYIGRHSENYDFERIPRVERNVIRLGVYELLFCPEIPPKVAIAEAIRITRKFATPEAATFVNAILDSIFKQADIKGDRTHVPTLSGLTV